jgi:hypothetical protein
LRRLVADAALASDQLRSLHGICARLLSHAVRVS